MAGDDKPVLGGVLVAPVPLLFRGAAEKAAATGGRWFALSAPWQPTFRCQRWLGLLGRGKEAELFVILLSFLRTDTRIALALWSDPEVSEEVPCTAALPRKCRTYTGRCRVPRGLGWILVPN